MYTYLNLISVSLLIPIKNFPIATNECVRKTNFLNLQQIPVIQRQRCSKKIKFSNTTTTPPPSTHSPTLVLPDQQPPEGQWTIWFAALSPEPRYLQPNEHRQMNEWSNECTELYLKFTQTCSGSCLIPAPPYRCGVMLPLYEDFPGFIPPLSQSPSFEFLYSFIHPSLVICITFYPETNWHFYLNL